MKTKDCTKCGGTGNIPRFGFYENGVCFRCKGSGKVKDRTPNKKREKKIELVAVDAWPFPH